MQKLVLFSLGCIIALILVAGCTDTSSAPVTPTQTLTPLPPKATVKPTTVAAVDDLQVLEDHVETGDYGTRYIVGSIKNNAGKQFSYAQVTINLYDASGAQVGSTMANINNLEAGGIWKFKAPILNKDATKYKIATTTAF